MATNTLNTRIVICSKTTTQWASTATVPMKGEVCLEWTSNDDFTIPPKVKVGNGTDTFANLPYIFLSESEIKALLEPATASKLGGVKIGSNVNVASDGTISVNNASTSQKGVVQLSDSTSSDSSTTAATSKAVKAAMDEAASAVTTVKQDGITGATVNRYGVCSTAASEAAKTASITTGTFALETGTKVTVKFNNANTANTPTLNINSTGAKNIFHNGIRITSGNNKALLAGVCDFVYDGTQWHLVGNYHDTTYSDATTSFHGLMSSEDKVAMDGLKNNYISAGGSTNTGEGSGFANLTETNVNFYFANATVRRDVAVDENENPITADFSVYINDATSTDSGLMSAADKAIVDSLASGAVTGVKGSAESTYRTGQVNITAANIGVAEGAEVNQNAFSTIAVKANASASATNITADSKTDTFTIVGGNNITLTPTANSDTLTIAATDTTYNDATTTTHGLMSTADKTKLNSIEDNADYTQIPIVTDKTTATDSTSTIEDATNALGFKFNNATIGTWEEVTRNTRTVNVRNITIDDATTSQKGIVKLSSATNSTSEILAATSKAVKAVADAAMPKSGGTFTGAVTLNADPTANMHAATKKYVDDHIAASDAMVFKGTLGTGGTVTAVPTSNVTKGDTYKIITAGTWAGYSGCKVGDLLIAMTTGTSVTANTTNWAYVPSGDEAVTTLKYSTTAGEVNVNTTAQTGALVVGGAAIKQVDADTMTSTSTNLPTSKAVATYVSGATANKANTLTTSRTIAIGGSATSTATGFDGSQNITIPLTGVDTNILYQTAGNTLVIDGNFT